jgi:hypothetical protein
MEWHHVHVMLVVHHLLWQYGFKLILRKDPFCQTWPMISLLKIPFPSEQTLIMILHYISWLEETAIPYKHRTLLDQYWRMYSPKCIRSWIAWMLRSLPHLCVFHVGRGCYTTHNSRNSISCTNKYLSCLYSKRPQFKMSYKVDNCFYCHRVKTQLQ